MEKILSIIIPTYNMEEYLSRCVDSLVKSDKIADIEVVIVNDGSKDKSLEIANSYKNKFPDSVVVIDKPNGNYGSTINAALPIITGKYVKILDADDWFDTNALDLFVKKLHSTDCDMVITTCTIVYVGGKKVIRSLCGVVENKMYDVNDFMQAANHMQFIMHMVTYRTDILTRNGYKQTEGISYTDNEWTFYPWYYINTIEYANFNLYHLWRGVEGQTMNPQTHFKNFWQEIAITRNMLKEYKNYDSKTYQSTIMLQILVQRIIKNYGFVMRTKFSEQNFVQLKMLKCELELHPSIKTMSETYAKGRLYDVYAVRHFNKTGKRFPIYITLILNLLFQLRSILKG